MDELGDDLLLLAAGSDGRLAIPAKLRFGLAGSELVRLAAISAATDAAHQAGGHGGHGGGGGGHH